MTITAILEECQYGDPALRVLAKSVNFASYGINASGGMPAGRITSMAGGIHPPAVSQYQRMLGRLVRKGQSKP